MPVSAGRVDDGRGLVLFVHGLWLHRTSWTPWEKLFDNSGYDCFAVTWPGERATVTGCRADSARRSTAHLLDLERTVRAATLSSARLPILIGHGVGGLIAQRLLGSGIAASISIAPVDLARPLSSAVVRLRLRSGGIRMHTGAGMPDAARFHRYYANTLGLTESTAIHEQYVIPSSLRMLDRPKRNRGVGRQPDRRPPSLLISGGRDRLVAENAVHSLEFRNRRRYPTAVSDHQVFPDRGHSLTVDSGWVDVAYHCLDWLTRQNL